MSMFALVGRWIEDHGVVHNMKFNTTTFLKIPHKDTLKISEWWDNGALPLWITAQKQVNGDISNRLLNVDDKTIINHKY